MGQLFVSALPFIGCVVICLVVVRLLVDRLTARLDASESALAELAERQGRDAVNIARIAEHVHKLQDNFEQLVRHQGELHAGLDEFTQEFQIMRNKVKMLEVSGKEPAARTQQPRGSSMSNEIAKRIAAGESVVEIAQQTGLQVGEVELIKGLKQFHPKDH